MEKPSSPYLNNSMLFLLKFAPYFSHLFKPVLNLKAWNNVSLDPVNPFYLNSEALYSLPTAILSTSRNFTFPKERLLVFWQWQMRSEWSKSTEPVIGPENTELQLHPLVSYGIKLNTILMDEIIFLYSVFHITVFKHFIHFLLVYLLFIIITWWGYIVAFTEVLTTYRIYHIWNYPFHHSHLSPPPSIPGIVSPGIIFHFHTYIHSICTIFTYTCTFPTSSPLPLVPTPPPKTCSALLFSDFVYFLKMTFLFV
jgi:hypothetical protein